MAKNKPRKPWVAVVLTLIAPGLGHIYAGKPYRGLIIHGGLLLILLGMVGVIGLLDWFGVERLLGPLVYGSAAIIYGLLIADVVEVVKPGKTSYQLQKYNRWYFYILICFGLLILDFGWKKGIVGNFIWDYSIRAISMAPTLKRGDEIYVNRAAYGVRLPFSSRYLWRHGRIRRGDIVSFRFPSEDPKATHCGARQYGKMFLKRVIGLPGEIVEIRGKSTYINGKRLRRLRNIRFVDPKRKSPPPYLYTQKKYQEVFESGKLGAHFRDSARDHFGPVRIPRGSYLVLGDNRDRSCDGRFWGPVHDKYIKGKAWVLYRPISRARSF